MELDITVRVCEITKQVVLVFFSTCLTNKVKCYREFEAYDVMSGDCEGHVIVIC